LAHHKKIITKINQSLHCPKINTFASTFSFGGASGGHGIKVRCYGEHIEEQIGNLENILKTYKNPLGTH
jgi:hypothetical protein